jgi:hypothetical protein
MDKYMALTTYMHERANAPFVWGVNDCCMFAADWVMRATGRDPIEALRGSWTDEASASHMLNAPGGLIRLVNTWGAREPLPTVATAQRGDVILFESGQGPALGICVGEKFAALKPPQGIGYFSMRHALAAWRVA